MADNLSFNMDLSAISQKLDEIFGIKAKEAIYMYAETAAADLESYMKRNRLWTDRTGSAKARLRAVVQEVAEGVRIALAHGVDYGIWLELGNEKRYAIIQPTINSKSDEIMQGFAKLLERLGS